MFMQAIRKNLKQKGAAIVEYAILLAFVAIIGAALLGPTSIPDSIDKVVTNIVELLGGKAPDTGGEEKPPTEPEEKPGTGGGSETPTPPTAEQEQAAIDELTSLRNKFVEATQQGNNDEAKEIKEQYKVAYDKFKKQGYNLNGIPASPNPDGWWDKKN